MSTYVCMAAKLIISNGDTPYIRGAIPIPTCAADHVETEQNGCRPRITALDRAIVMRTVNWISNETMFSFDRII